MDNCIERPGAATKGGYPVIQIGGTSHLAHRISYQLFNGRLNPYKEVDHTCRNIRCINPAHLEQVTPRENKRRAALMKTHCPQGHSYEDAYISRRGWRHCRTCSLARARAQGAARRAARLSASSATS